MTFQPTPTPVGGASDQPAGQDFSVPSSLSVTATAAACTVARHWTTTELVRLGVTSSALRDDAELVVSELVSNAVQHGLAPIVVSLLRGDAGLTVSVGDSAEPPYLFGSRPADPTASRGRGLAIVATVAIAWGIQARHPGPGKNVWARLRDDLAGIT